MNTPGPRTGTEVAANREALVRRLAELSPAQRRLVAHMLRKTGREARYATIPRRAPSATAPLSYAQQRLWMLDQFQPHSPFYNESFASRFTHEVDVSALHRAFNEIVRRHESLRTTFQVRDEEPVQVVDPTLTIPLPVVDLRTLSPLQRDATAMQMAQEHALLPFDLARGPLIRTDLYQLDRELWLLLVTMHHIVCDGWSGGLFLWELETLYEAFAAGRPSPLPELQVQYADFAVWERSQRGAGPRNEHLAYWKHQLAGLPSLDLPSDRPRPPVPTYHGGTVERPLSEASMVPLRHLSQSENATVFMTLLAAFAVLLHRYSGQDDFAIGVPNANRDRPELAGVIGFFINILVVRIDCSGDPTFRELLQRVRNTTVAAYANQDVQFETLVDELHPERDTSRNPLFQITCQYLRDAMGRASSMGRAQDLETGIAKFDMRLDIVETDTTVDAYLEYSGDLFVRETAERMLGQLGVVIDSVGTDPDRRIGDVPLLTAAERHQMLVEWNRTDAPYPGDTCVHALVERRAADRPRSLAISDAERSVTYDELNRRANQLAHHLRSRGVGPEVPVAICLERSVDAVVALLAVLKAGGAYVPLDPAYPAARIEQLLDDAAARLVVTRDHLDGVLEHSTTPCWRIDRDWAEVAELSEENPVSGVQPGNLAYIIYTSGSTGTPRGVAIEHRALMNLVTWHAREYVVTCADRVTQIASPAFDASVWELWPYLSQGASIHIPDDETVALPDALVTWLTGEGITLTFLPTPLAEVVMDRSWPPQVALRALLTGGDKLRRAPGPQLPFRLINHYGPTENTVVTTFAPIEADGDVDGTPPIGRPIGNVRTYVLDRRGNPVPIGVPGELCVAGDGLARGYVHLPETTAERFVDNHLERAEGSRMYRTGDLVRYRADGNLEFLGRMDHQVKVRGFRIELGEIEGLLGRHPAVQECSVLAHGEGDGAVRLVAYVVPNLDAGLTGAFSPTEFQELHVAQWRRMYDETYRQPVRGGDPRTNLVGWNSSYTGRPIPAEEMREQIDQTVARLRHLRPRRVLEIGCGTGLLLFELAPGCDRYVGTDFSPAALEHVRAHLDGDRLRHVTLLERRADDFCDLEPGSFDLVVLNSTVQYFPSAEYLMSVLEGAGRVVAPGGHVFVGDVRSLPLLETFHVDVELLRAGPAESTRDVRERAHRRLRQEPELVIAPELFATLDRTIPALRCADVMLKRGRHHNELTRYRYDVVLQVGGARPDPGPSAILDWGDVASLGAVRELLRARPADRLTVNGVPNARLRRQAEAAALVGDLDHTVSVRRLGTLLEDVDPGVDPEDVWALERELPVDVHLAWTPTGSPGCFDAVFRPAATNGDHTLVPWTGAAATPGNPPTNIPIQRELIGRLAPILRAYARDHVPEYMVPSAFVAMGTMPRTPNGKIDRRALPLPLDTRPPVEGRLTAPRTKLEREMTAIWQEVLGVDQVGTTDNFFDIGGHSLLLIRVHGLLTERLGLECSVLDLFQFPTIRTLAGSLDATA